MFGYGMVLPMNTGAEAVETAVKLSRKWAYMKKGVPEGKAVVLSVEGNFHGRTLGIIRCLSLVHFYFYVLSCSSIYLFICSMSTDPESRRGFGPYLEGVGPTFVDEEGDTQMIRYGVLKDLETALDLYGENVAAFLVEPIQGEAG